MLRPASQVPPCPRLQHLERRTELLNALDQPVRRHLGLATEDRRRLRITLLRDGQPELKYRPVQLRRTLQGGLAALVERAAHHGGRVLAPALLGRSWPARWLARWRAGGLAGGRADFRCRLRALQPAVLVFAQRGQRRVASLLARPLLLEAQAVLQLLPAQEHLGVIGTHVIRLLGPRGRRLCRARQHGLARRLGWAGRVGDRGAWCLSLARRFDWARRFGWGGGFGWRLHSAHRHRSHRASGYARVQRPQGRCRGR